MASILDDVRGVVADEEEDDEEEEEEEAPRLDSLEQAPVLGESAEARLSGLEVTPAAAAAAAAIEANVMGFFKVADEMEPRESFKSILPEQPPL